MPGPHAGSSQPLSSPGPSAPPAAELASQQPDRSRGDGPMLLLSRLLLLMSVPLPLPLRSPLGLALSSSSCSCSCRSAAMPSVTWESRLPRERMHLLLWRTAFDLPPPLGTVVIINGQCHKQFSNASLLEFLRTNINDTITYQGRLFAGRQACLWSFAPQAARRQRTARAPCCGSARWAGTYGLE